MKRIIIIDDDDSARTVLRGMLEDGGYEVAAEGRDGSEAVPLCRKHSPDVVIMDVRMPGTDGITAAGEISRTSPAAVVIITAGADPDTIARATEAGVMGYLVKPVRSEELAPAVELASKRFSELRILADENLELRGAVRA
ncbi:MAG TPA: response regulator, partial [Gammaproteobacteria bacterium]|nr:response regulator [Gammaproteobacteria bacterium]